MKQMLVRYGFIAVIIIVGAIFLGDLLISNWKNNTNFYEEPGVIRDKDTHIQIGETLGITEDSPSEDENSKENKKDKKEKSEFDFLNEEEPSEPKNMFE